MKYDRLVIGYHGCRTGTAQAILAGEAFTPSENDFDWLGRGIYFWEFGYDRACRFAEAKFPEPAVVGAIIQLRNCFDLGDTRHTRELLAAYDKLEEVSRLRGLPLPANTSGPDRKARRLDCAVVNFALDSSPELYECVRCPFTEGPPAYAGSGIMRESHIQVAVRNPACILGVFRPTIVA